MTALSLSNHCRQVLLGVRLDVDVAGARDGYGAVVLIEGDGFGGVAGVDEVSESVGVDNVIQHETVSVDAVGFQSVKDVYDYELKQ